MLNNEIKDIIQDAKKNDALIALIKFGKFIHNNDFRENGHIFMNNAGFYKNLEEEQKRKGQGDKTEGRIMTIRSFKLYPYLDDETVSDKPTVSIENINDNQNALYALDKYPIFCMYAVRYSDLIEVGENQYKIIIPWDVINAFADNDDKKSPERISAVLICSVQSFVNEFMSEVEKRGFRCIRGFVNYHKHPNPKEKRLNKSPCKWQ